jgi:hypothetical protein
MIDRPKTAHVSKTSLEKRETLLRPNTAKDVVRRVSFLDEVDFQIHPNHENHPFLNNNSNQNVIKKYALPFKKPPVRLINDFH